MDEIRVEHLMSTQLVTLFAEQCVPLARDLMEMRRIRHIPVVDGETLVGLVAYRDLVQAQVERVRRLMDREGDDDVDLAVPVSKIMEVDVWTVAPTTPALEAANIMNDHDFGCLPVVSGKKLVGIITEADFLEMTIRVLKRHRQSNARPPMKSEATAPSPLRVILAVDDLGAAKEFYHRAFRWSVQEQTASSVSFRLPDRSMIVLCERDTYAKLASRAPVQIAANAVSSTQLFLHCDDLYGVISRLEGLGARCLSRLQRRSSGEDAAIFADLSGNPLIIARSSRDSAS